MWSEEAKAELDNVKVTLMVLVLKGMKASGLKGSWKEAKAWHHLAGLEY